MEEVWFSVVLIDYRGSSILHLDWLLTPTIATFLMTAICKAREIELFVGNGRQLGKEVFKFLLQRPGLDIIRGRRPDLMEMRLSNNVY